MIKPSITELTNNGQFNRYVLSMATAKCARAITDEYVKQREIAEYKINNKETDKNLASMISREYRDEKAVKVAVNKLNNRDYVIVGYTDEEHDTRKKSEPSEKAEEE
ncbi:MAG: hypothetical protein PUC29_04665 [Clostridia bacterium]|nr:hypothetical protein [Clostridia bacterium]